MILNSWLQCKKSIMPGNCDTSKLLYGFIFCNDYYRGKPM